MQLGKQRADGLDEVWETPGLIGRVVFERRVFHGLNSHVYYSSRSFEVQQFRKAVDQPHAEPQQQSSQRAPGRRLYL